MKTSKKILAEINEAKDWIEWNKIFIAALSRNKIIDQSTMKEREMDENELFLKPTWIINNLTTQTNQYELILSNTKLLLNSI